MQVLSKAWVVYALTVVGSLSVVVLLSPVVLMQLIVLARPCLEGPPPPLSLMQRREIEATRYLPPSHIPPTPLVPTKVPTEPLGLYAAQLDVAEGQEVPAFPVVSAYELQSAPSSIATEKMKLRVARAEPEAKEVTARDIFNHSFGVLTAETN